MKNTVVAALAASALMIGTAAAETSAGVSEVNAMLTSLKVDMGTVVTAGLLVAIVGIGALAALSLGKRFLGSR